MYWTPAKMQLFADVGGYSFANAATSGAAGDENIVKMTTCLFQCIMCINGVDQHNGIAVLSDQLH